MFVDKPNLTPREASAYLNQRWGIQRAVQTLAKLRCYSSAGPIFLKASRGVLYPREGLDAYALSMLSAPMRSTSERPHAQAAA